MGLLDLGGLLDQVLALVEDLLASLGLIDVPEVPDVPADEGALQELIDTLLAAVVELLESLGLIETPDLPASPDNSASGPAEHHTPSAGSATGAPVDAGLGVPSGP